MVLEPELRDHDHFTWLTSRWHLVGSPTRRRPDLEWPRALCVETLEVRQRTLCTQKNLVFRASLYPLHIPRFLSLGFQPH